MNQLIQNWMDALEAAEVAREAIDDALDAAETAIPDGELRPAMARDIYIGNIIWYPRWRDDEPGCRWWRMVDEVLHPDDPWKAYTSDDGCRYGLDGAFVEAQ